MNSAKSQRYSSAVTQTHNERIEDDRSEMERKEVKMRQIGPIYVRIRNIRQLHSLMYLLMKVLRFIILFSFRSSSAAIKLGPGRGEDTDVPERDDGIQERHRRGKARQIRHNIRRMRRHADVRRRFREVRDSFLTLRRSRYIYTSVEFEISYIPKSFSIE